VKSIEAQSNGYDKVSIKKLDKFKWLLQSEHEKTTMHFLGYAIIILYNISWKTSKNGQMAMAKWAQRTTHEDYPHHLNGYGCVTMKQHELSWVW
jgi:hypothetical protein